MQPKCECGADQVPGRTIAESESKDLFNTARRGLEYWPDALERTGITVVPDPEPTNAEKLEPAVRQIMADVRLNGPHSETSVYWAGRLDAAGVRVVTESE